MTKTPNKYHYMPLIATISPTWFHKFYNKLRGRASEDTFPTRYLLNSTYDQENKLKENGFVVDYIEQIEGRPEYLRITFLTYLLGLMYEKFVNSLNLDKIKILLISKFIKNENSLHNR